MKKIWLLLFLIPVVSAYTISDWPYFFVNNNRFSAIYVIGEESPALDVVSATVISTSLAKYENVTTEIGTSKLDTEVSDITAKNAVVVGSPCENRAAYLLMGSPEPCYKDLAGSVGYIKLYEHNGKVQLLITGFHEKDRNAAAKFLANSNIKVIKSSEFVINSNSGSIPQYFDKKKNETNTTKESNVTKKVNVTKEPVVPESVTNVTVSENAKPVFGPYEPLEEIPVKEKKGFFGRLWDWIKNWFV